ncbi:MAG: hypothetical protein ACRDG7_04580 [Candidatus Limnocylindria bacterium]
MRAGVLTAASLGASRGILEFELREWPAAAAAAGIGLSLAAQLLADRPEVLVTTASALALVAILVTQQRRA